MEREKLIRLVQHQSQEIEELKQEIEYLIRKPMGKNAGAIDSPIPNVQSPILQGQDYITSTYNEAAMAAEPRSESAPAERPKTAADVVIPPATEEGVTS